MSDSSGTVCRWCKEPLELVSSADSNSSGKWFVKGMPNGLASQWCYNDQPHNPEPAPAEQPRPCMWPNSGSCSCEPRNPNHTFMTGSVAASPEGPRREKCPSCGASMPGFCTLVTGAEHLHNGLKSECCKNPWHFPTAQPSPDAAKVEEITQELIKRLNLEDEEEAEIAAILRPYFPQVSAKSCDWPFSGCCSQPEACLKANRCLKNLPNSESEVMPIPDNANVCKGSSAGLKTPGLAGEATAPCMWPSAGSCSCVPVNPNHTFITHSAPGIVKWDEITKGAPESNGAEPLAGEATEGRPGYGK